MGADHSAWTYDITRGFWTSTELSDCITLGFGNEDAKTSYPEFYVICLLHNTAKARNEPHSIRLREMQRKSLMKAAEALACHRRKHQCDCDFFVGDYLVHREQTEERPLNGPINVSQRGTSKMFRRIDFLGMAETGLHLPLAQLQLQRSLLGLILSNYWVCAQAGNISDSSDAFESNLDRERISQRE